MIIVTERPYSGGTFIVAERGHETFVKGTARVVAFCTEEEFRSAYPNAPEFKDYRKMAIWTCAVPAVWPSE